VSTARRFDTRLVGRSEAIRLIDAEVECAARSDAKVLVTGETGVGKEVVARLIHYRSHRASAPLVTVNCAGLPDSLLESELFGHVRGSFTGAYRDKPGLLELAPHGTVFLDEIGEMSTRMQIVLLRFLESGEIQRLGAERPHARANVRVIAATNRDLPAAIDAGTFREDLFFRLNVIRIHVPPLRERVEDVPLLVKHFLREFGRVHQTEPFEVADAAMAAFCAYRWPGNVRELCNVVERAVLKARGPAIQFGDLPVELTGATIRIQTPARSEAPPPPTQVESMTERMLSHGDSFWAAVYPAFMARDMTRNDLRAIVRRGLEETSGNYRGVVRRFNMPADDYKRFLGFLRKHDCHLPFQKFRAVQARLPQASTAHEQAAAQ